MFAFKLHQSVSETYYSAIASEMEKNFASCIMSPFKSSIEYHGLVKYLANHSTSAPTTRTSDDGMEITYKKVTLDVRLWRKGLEQLQKTATEAIDRVCYGRGFGFENPVRVRDDWSNTCRAHTGFNPQTFLAHPLPLLDAMLHDKALGLASSPDGKSIKFDQYKIQKQLAVLNGINKMLALLIFFLCGGPARLAEFCDGKFANSHRPRSLFLDEQGTVWYVVRRVKWENLVKREVFLPKKCPPGLSNLLKKYLIIIRPVETHLSRHIHEKGTEAAELAIHNYSTFLWVRDGERVKSSTLGKDIAHFLQNECGCEDGNPSSYRHFAVEMSRIFIEQVSFIDLAQQRGHSVKTAQSAYAVEVDHLPAMSSDVLLHFGKMSELWWNLAGEGPNNELPVPFWMREERRRDELLELKSEVSELKGEVSELKGEVSELKKGLSQLERAVGQTGRKADEKAEDVKQTLQMIYRLVNDLSGR